MLVRPTRSLAILLGVVAFLFIATLLEGSLKSYSRNKLSIITAPTHEASRPPPRIVAFWEKWATVFDKARPTIRPIQSSGEASVDGSDKVEGDRKPSAFTVGLKEKDVESLRRSHSKLVNYPGFNTTNKESVRMFHGTGVVIVAGGEYFAPALVSIRMLRKTNTTLPIQVFVQSKSEYEREICEEVLPDLNAECFVIEDFLRKDNPFKVTHYQLKVLAVIFSTFETVFLLDSDCMAMRDPNELLKSEPFISTGFLSWSDYWLATEDPVFYQIAGLSSFPTGLPALSSESGQLAISKKKHLTSLLLAAYYNIFGPNFYYPIFSQGAPGEGDKETFLAGAVVLGNPYYRIKEHVGTIGFFDPTSEFHGTAMIQYHAGDEYASQNETEHKKPRPFFIHANTPKLNVGDLLDQGWLVMPGTDDRLRMWGSTTMFDFDVEKVVWNEMWHLACELEHVLKEFKKRQDLCRRAEEHYKELFDPNATSLRATSNPPK
ncbi:hypothetical protein MMC28_004701 [Mycoblastus sanguinarius]|nr:hypothetical protein [Mycoblastus sanguinarius]